MHHGWAAVVGVAATAQHITRMYYIQYVDTPNKFIVCSVNRHNPAMMSALHGAQAAAAANGRDVQVHVLPDAGHWLHADNPSGLAALLLPWLVHAGSTT